MMLMVWRKWTSGGLLAWAERQCRRISILPLVASRCHGRCGFGFRNHFKGRSGFGEADGFPTPLWIPPKVLETKAVGYPHEDAVLCAVDVQMLDKFASSTLGETCSKPCIHIDFRAAKVCFGDCLTAPAARTPWHGPGDSSLQCAPARPEIGPPSLHISHETNRCPIVTVGRSRPAR